MSVKDYIPAAKRKLVYAVFAFLGLGLGAVQVGFATAELGTPVWLSVSLAVYTFVAAAVGFTAQGSVDKSEEDEYLE